MTDGMFYSDDQFRLLAGLVSKHTGKTFKFSARNVRPLVANALLAIDDETTWTRLRAEVAAAGLLPPNEGHLSPKRAKPPTVAEELEEDLPTRGAFLLIVDALRDELPPRRPR